MFKIYVIMGKSATGKDSIYKEILSDKELQLREIVTYTTRPMRNNEQDGVEYYFVDEKRLEELEKSGKIIERRVYNTIHGPWNYFTVDDGQVVKEGEELHRYMIIGTLESYVKIRDYYGRENVVPLYIDVEDGERLQRALNREKVQQEPKYPEMCRRFLADCEDFSKDRLKEAEVDTVYYNNVLEECINEIKNVIM